MQNSIILRLNVKRMYYLPIELPSPTMIWLTWVCRFLLVAEPTATLPPPIYSEHRLKQRAASRLQVAAHSNHHHSQFPPDEWWMTIIHSKQFKKTYLLQLVHSWLYVLYISVFLVQLRLKLRKFNTCLRLSVLQLKQHAHSQVQRNKSELYKQYIAHFMLIKQILRLTPIIFLQS